MNRRSFLSSIITAGASAAFLPHALTYARKWKPTPAGILTPSGILTHQCEEALILYDRQITYDVTLVVPPFSELPQRGDRVSFNGVNATVTELHGVDLPQANDPCPVKVRLSAAVFDGDLHDIPRSSPKINGLVATQVVVRQEFQTRHVYGFR